MPVNPSDIKFFQLLSQTMQKIMEEKKDISIDTLRSAVKTFTSLAGVPAEIPFKDIKITCLDGHTLRLRYYAHDANIKPIIVYFPGNAFIHDLFEENHAVISKIAHFSGCHAIMVDYRLAPENTYPKQLHDAKEALEYIINHDSIFHFDKNKIILSGYSSGANLAAVLTNLLRDDPNIFVFHQFLISGAYDYTNSLHEYDNYALEDKMLDPESAELSFNCYCKLEQRKEPTCSPYWEKDLSNLPPTTIMVSEYDGGRSQSEGYAKRLIKAGNEVTKIILSGQTHGSILYRQACSDGEDPAIVAGKRINTIVNTHCVRQKNEKYR